MIASRERHKVGADRAPVVRRRGILTAALVLLSVILMLSGFAAPGAFASDAGAQELLYANPELRFLHHYTFGDKDKDSHPPSCAAAGGVCSPIFVDYYWALESWIV